MSTITKNNIKKQLDNQYGNGPYGNMTTLRFRLTCDSSGIWTDSDDGTTLVDGDICHVGILPIGFRVLDSVVNIVTPGATNCDGILGLYTVSTGVVIDADYFNAAAALGLDGTAPVRKTNITETYKCVADTYVTLEIETAAVGANAMDLEICIIGEISGQP